MSCAFGIKIALYRNYQRVGPDRNAGGLENSSENADKGPRMGCADM